MYSLMDICMYVYIYIFSDLLRKRDSTSALSFQFEERFHTDRVTRGLDKWGRLLALFSIAEALGLRIGEARTYTTGG